MKKKLLFSILGMVAVSAPGQGTVKLDNYNTYGPYVTYGVTGDGPVGAGVSSAYTMGLYYWNALGDFTGSTDVDPTGLEDPIYLGNYLPATGPGSTAQFGALGKAGAAVAGSAWNVPIVPGTIGGATVTLMVVAYEGASYGSAFYRGHSAPFTLVTSDSTNPNTVKTGSAMPAFNVYGPLPEPSTIAFVCLTVGSWLFIRSKSS